MPRRDAIALLKEDHKNVRGLLEELAETTGRASSKRERLLAKIEMELQVHTKIEEEIFYPAYKDAARAKDDRKLFYEATEEHHLVEIVLEEMKNSELDSEEFSAKAKVLKDLVEHHIREEEKEMFPKAKELLSAERLQSLGEEIEGRKPIIIEEFEHA